jgi:hypothetical protein
MYNEFDRANYEKRIADARRCVREAREAREAGNRKSAVVLLSIAKRYHCEATWINPLRTKPIKPIF